MPFNLKNILIKELTTLRSINASSFPKLNVNGFGDNSNNPIQFLLTILKIVVGWETIKTELSTFLVYNLNDIEKEAKRFLVNLLKKHFICNDDFLVPDYMIDDGFNLQIKNIDLFQILKVDPVSDIGKLIYLNSAELNAFLYQIIKGTAQDGNWKSIVSITYLSSGNVYGQLKNDVFNVKINESYRNISLNKFLSDYLNSIELFNVSNIINKTFDILFGTISSKMGKSQQQLKDEEELYQFITKIIELPEEFDNSYYDFNTVELNTINAILNQKTNGGRLIKNCGGDISTVNINELFDLNELIANNSATLIDLKRIIDSKFEVIENEITTNVKDGDKQQGLLEFYFEFFNAIIKAIISLIFSPKIMLFFLIYFRFGNLQTLYKSPLDFVKLNVTFVTDLIRNNVMPIIISFLVRIIIKAIKEIIGKDKINRQKEMNKYKLLAYSSLLGLNRFT
jgi:hypothetical protein